MARNIQLLRLLGMIGDLTAARYGVLVSDMMEKYGVSRRTLERDVEALAEAGYLVETLPDEEPGRVRKRIVSRHTSPSFPVSCAELAAARAAVLALEHDAPPVMVATFRVLIDRLQQMQPTSVRLNSDTLAGAQAVVGRPGYMPVVDACVLSDLQHAVMSCRRVTISYRRGGSGDSRKYKAEPYGVLIGGKGYLVWRGCDDKKYRKFSLPYIDSVDVTDETFCIDPTFSLNEYAGQSFGVMADEVMDVELRIAPDGRSRLHNYVFHSSQIVVFADDGFSTIRFQASGLFELCCELFGWGSLVTIVKPDRLRSYYIRLLLDALAAIDSDKIETCSK